MPDSLFVGLAAIVALLAALAYHGVSGIARLRSAEKTDLLWAAIGGALAFWAAPLLALSQRATDTPSGADTLFLASSVSGLAVVCAAYISRAERPGPTAIAGAVASVAGAAGMLASWESPSSFSPFAKFPAREALMLLAAVLFAVGLLALARAIRRAGPQIATLGGLAGAAVVGLLGALPWAADAISSDRRALVWCLYLGLSTALFALGLLRSVADVGLSRSSVALLGAPLAVMASVEFEQFRAVYGPNPVAWSAATAGIAVVIGGAVVVWFAEKPGRPTATSRRHLVPLVVAAVACAFGLASLATPALSALAEGGTSEPFHASWTMVGAESAVGWLAFAAAGLALSAALSMRVGESVRAWGSAAVGSLLCVLAALPLAGTTLHTWNSWVPANVQQTYGTEYSRLVIDARFDFVRTAALMLAALAVAALIVSAWRMYAAESTQEEVVR